MVAPFNFEIPVEVWYKAGEAGKERRIGGIISTERKDRQNEIVLQRGLDFSDFLSSGWINDNHSKDTTGIVGYPIKVERTSYKGKPATYFEGYLLQGYPRADEIWRLSNALQKTNRRLGFSIEGSVERRDGMEGEIVAKAKVRNIAVTNCPVNNDSRLEILAKSLLTLGQVESPPDEMIRALNAGPSAAAVGGPIFPGNGAPLRPQSMERIKDIRRKKKINKSEAILLLKSRYPNLSTDDAIKIFNFAANAAYRGE